MRPSKMIDKRMIPHNEMDFIILYLRSKYGIAGYIRRAEFNPSTERYEYWIEFIYQ